MVDPADVVRDREKGSWVEGHHVTKGDAVRVQQERLIVSDPALEIYRSGGYWTTVSRACGATMVRGCLRVILSSSLIRSATAATIRKHGGQPAVTGSSLSERQAPGLLWGPNFCVKAALGSSLCNRHTGPSLPEVAFGLPPLFLDFTGSRTTAAKILLK